MLPNPLIPPISSIPTTSAGLPTPADSAENLCRVGGIGGLKPTLQPPYESPDSRLRGNDESIRTETCTASFLRTYIPSFPRKWESRT
ncbi:hypothetical protein NEIPOLOT_01597 [Neisseria polysaccharea ATCC 43768]|nr:hypothetical protein NEIPOLOT_01597 [Neisseria polysaccharea ATCC 43768]